MEMLMNPVLIGVVLLCVLCLFKLNVLMSMLISLFVAGMLGGVPLFNIKDDAGEVIETGIMTLLTSGFSGNAETALAYVLLGTFATAMAYTGIAGLLSRKITKVVSGKRMMLLLVIAGVACLSQNVVPVHIAFIPIMIPPLLLLMNELKIDRRAMACSLAFGLKAPYIALPFGFGLIFQGIIAKNLTDNGIETTVSDVAAVNWILAVAMFIGLLIALFITYRKPREYKNVDLGIVEETSTRMEMKHWVTIVAIIVMVGLQIKYGSLPVAAMGGLLVMIIGGAIKWNDIDDQFAGGIKIMGFIAFVMLIAGGFANVMKATGGVDSLVESTVGLMGGSKLIAATLITLIGLLVTMGIGTSFGTIPVLAVLYVPLCQQMGFSPAATILLISAAAALGDAGSPASDTTLGPTAGLNADGQHDHIWDTCVPTFMHYNIPLMIAAILGAQIL